MAPVGIPFPVALTITGRPIVILLWLGDGARAVLVAPTGVEFTAEAVLSLVPTQVGSWPLYAAAVDANGCSDQTGIPGTVSVQ